MIYTAFAVSFIGSVALFKAERRATSQGRQRRKLILRGLREFTVPLAISTGIFSLLELWVSMTVGDVNAATSIGQIEHAIRRIRNSYVEPLVLHKTTQFWIVAALLVLGLAWPRIRAARITEKYKRLTLWITRAHITATLLASFTFFNSVHADHATAAVVRLRREIKEIGQKYEEAFGNAEEALVDSAAGQVADDPALSPSVVHVYTAYADHHRADVEIQKALDEVKQAPDAELRAFKLPIDDLATRSFPKPRATQRETFPRVNRENWTLAEGRRLASETETLRREEHVAVEMTKEMTEAGADVVHEAGQHLLASLLSGTPFEGIADVALDPEVLYDFRDIPVRAAAKYAERISGGGTNVRQAFATLKAEIRDALQAKAKSISQRVEVKLANYATTATSALHRAVVVHGQTDRDFLVKANEQAQKEGAALQTEVATALSEAVPELRPAAESLVGRLTEGPDLAPMTRVARIRKLRSDLAIDGQRPTALLSALSDEERKLGGPRPFDDAVQLQVEYLLLPEPLSSWGSLRAHALAAYRSGRTQDRDPNSTLKMLKAWEEAKRYHAKDMAAHGKKWIEADEWERFFNAYCQEHSDMAVMWGWFVKGRYHNEIAARYSVDNVVPQHGYRYYLEQTGFGGASDARGVFGTPLAEETIDVHCSAGRGVSPAPRLTLDDFRRAAQ